MSEPTTAPAVTAPAATAPAATAPVAFDPEVEALLERYAAVGQAADEQGWLELPPMIEASLAVARGGYLANACFDLGTCEDLIGATLSGDAQRARQFGDRYTPLEASRRAALESWRAELKELRKELLAVVQRAADAARAKREEADRLKRARSGW